MTNGWTLAYRKRTANRFQRVTDWAGTWQQARDKAREFGERHPELQVYYVTTAAYEKAEAARLAGQVARGEMAQDLADHWLADHGNLLVDSGKRVRMVDNGTIL